MENITAVLEVLSLDNKSIADPSAFANAIVSHVQAERRVLSRVMPKLLEQVSVSP